MSIARVLVVAGSDSGGGAGVQADIKAITMLGGHAMTAITAITAQNTMGVQAVQALPVEMVLAQIDSVVSDIGADAVKIGMIGSAEIVHAVAERLEAMPDVPVVFDPVMIATSGSVLADEETIAAFARLMRRATLVTPNVPELRALSASTVRPELVEGRNGASAIAARVGRAAALAQVFDAAVLAKGGDADEDEVVDILALPGGGVESWTNPRIVTPHTHGTGCTLASGIACGIAQGLALEPAIARAIRFVRASLAHAPGLGQGHGPMGHALGIAPFDVLEARV